MWLNTIFSTPLMLFKKKKILTGTGVYWHEVRGFQTSGSKVKYWSWLECNMYSNWFEK